MRERHNVYVIELDKDVLYEAKFKKANPDYVTGKPCVYVGMTSTSIEIKIPLPYLNPNFEFGLVGRT